MCVLRFPLWPSVTLSLALSKVINIIMSSETPRALLPSARMLESLPWHWTLYSASI